MLRRVDVSCAEGVLMLDATDGGACVIFRRDLACPEGFEPPTVGLEGRRFLYVLVLIGVLEDSSSYCFIKILLGQDGLLH